MMSRNLKGGVGKNFNFAFSSDDSQESPALKDKDQSQSDEDDVSQPQQRFGSRPINLLSQKGKTRGGPGGAPGIKKGLALITTDED